jgi:hypothetical protein
MSDAELRLWADTWQRAGRELDALRRRELAAMTDDDVRRAIALIFSDYSPEKLPPRTTSGLIEQQRLFGLLRARP